MLYSYKRSFSGFSAMLNSTQATTLAGNLLSSFLSFLVKFVFVDEQIRYVRILKFAEMDGVISVFRSRMVELHTTRSWDFLGLNLASHNSEANPLQLAYGHDIIVAVLDSGLQTELMCAFSSIL